MNLFDGLSQESIHSQIDDEKSTNANSDSIQLSTSKSKKIIVSQDQFNNLNAWYPSLGKGAQTTGLKKPEIVSLSNLFGFSNFEENIKKNDLQKELVKQYKKDQSKFDEIFKSIIVKEEDKFGKIYFY
jgi:hypothetical protein